MRWFLVALLGSATLPLKASAAPDGVPSVATSTALRDEDLKYFDEAPPILGDTEADEEVIDRASVFGNRVDLTRVAGSAHRVDEAQLELFEFDDILEVLATVPGVYVREEDGYGLRPNIGMRGAFSDRSSKVVLMEDNVLLGPAPYAAPAAYYFPLMTRMTSVEVFKGPAAVVAGPNTIGGAINLTTRDAPDRTIAYLDVAGGLQGYLKLHGYAGTGSEVWGILLEGVHLSTEGFKELPTDDETGFDRNDLMFKARVNTKRSVAWRHGLELKLGYGREVSHETYLGLADEDFAENGLQRYSASSEDRMEWERTQIQLEYETGKKDWGLRVTGYRHDFHRVWLRFNDFLPGVDEDPDNPLVSRPVGDILRADDEGAEELKEVLRGNLDSRAVSDGEPAFMELTTNDRTFVSQGVQAGFEAEVVTGPIAQVIQAGARFHADEIERDQPLSAWEMVNGRMVPTDDAAVGPGTENNDFGRAFAVFAKDTVTWGPVSLSPGLRVEVVTTGREDASGSREQTNTAVLPGVGLLVAALPQLSLLAGVHRGFSPVAPGQDESVDPETSWNYEAGARFGVKGVYLETIGFWNDYQNIVANCTFSTGCPDGNLDDQDALGAATVRGVEALANLSSKGPFDFTYGLQLAYTYTDGRFDTAISDSTFNPRFAGAQAGDHIPDIPEHIGSFTGTVQGKNWAFALSGRGQSRMWDEPEKGRDLPDTFFSDPFFVLDVAGHYSPTKWLEFYARAQNLFDARYIASRRPFGARPGQPFLFFVGLKLRYAGPSFPAKKPETEVYTPPG